MDEKTHARYSAIARTYHYHLLIEKNPFQLPFAWYYRFPLDVPLMNQAAALMLQHNDFKCFCKTNSSAEHYLCKVTKAEWLITKRSIRGRSRYTRGAQDINKGEDLAICLTGVILISISSTKGI